MHIKKQDFKMPFRNKLGQSDNCICGLVFYLNDLNISSDEAVPVSLQNVNIHANIVDFVSEVTVTQSYINAESTPIEVVYMFPIEEEAAVTFFEAEVDGRKIVTQVKEKEEAREEYKEAMKNKKTAALLEETQPDIFRIKLGQVKPGAGAKIVLKYICEMPVEESKIRLTIPTTIAPRYVSPTDKSESAPLIASIPYSMKTPAGLSVNIEGLMQSKIKSVQSPSHDVKIQLKEECNSHGQYTFNGTLSTKTTDMDGDIIILIEGEDEDAINNPTVFLERHEDDNHKIGYVGMVSMVPSFKLKDQSIELIFLVDRSGSMRGSSIEQAKKALELFLHSMPSECYFNIWSFGSSFDALFTEGSAKYSDNSMKEAVRHVKSMDADYGGTEMYNPLKNIFDQTRPSKSHLRQIFVLTDGEVSNAPMVNSLVKEKRGQGRVFSLGIGSSASRLLVKGIARAGDGTAVFANEREDLRPKVLGQLRKALQPAVSNITIAWEGVSQTSSNTSKYDVELETKKTLLGYMKPTKTEKRGDKDNINHEMFGQVPTNVPPIFDGSRLLLYHIFETECPIPNNVTITAETPDGSLSAEIVIDESNILDTGNFVRKLAARKKIQELEEETIFGKYGYGNMESESSKNKKAAIVKLGIENGIASKHTSFIGVDEKTNKEISEKPMMTREIKNQVPSGFGYGNYYASPPGGYAPMASPPGGYAPMKSYRATDSGAMLRGGVTKDGKLRSRSAKSSNVFGKYVNIGLHLISKF